jgi:hypothetical protein
MSSKRTIVLLGIALLTALALAAQLCSSRLAARRGLDDGSAKQASSGETSRASLKHPRAAAPPNTGEKNPSARHGDTGNARHVALPAVSFESQSQYGALVGRVVNWSSRRGVAGAELSFMHEGVSHTLTTASDGSYRFEAPSPGTWVLAAVTADGFLPYAPDFGRDSVVFVARPRREIQHADLLLFPAVDYVGLVVDQSGKPVAGAEVELFGADSGERAMVGIPSSFRSDGEGRFEFHAPDNALLEARHPDHAPGRARLDGAAAISHTLTITLGSAPSSSTASITGSVVDASGVGITGVELTAEADRPGPFTREATGTTDDDGSFRLGPLDEHSYVVVARLRGRPSLRSAVVEPGAHVELRMASGNVLRGQLVDDAGQPVPMGTVVLREVAGPLARTHVSGLSVFDPQGEFEFREVPPGNYELLAIAQGRPRSEPTPVTVPTVDLVRVVLEDGARLSGEVLEQGTNEPIEMALVTVDGIDGDDSILSALSSTVTDAEGRFELVGVTPGRVSVNVAAFAHDARIISGVELEPGQAHGPLRIELAPVAKDARPKTEITGIGVAIGTNVDVLSINEVFPGGGAEAAGIVAGESILAVDGTAVAELGFEEAIQNIRGQVGTTVEIELLRLDGSRATLEVERRVVQTP